MANTILITANWHTGALSQQTISRQYDNNRYVVQFIGYPEASEGNELDYYLLVWMSSAPGERPDEIAPIQLASDQWYISNVFTQQTQQIKFQMCALNTEGTFEAHSPIFTGFVRNSLDHDGTTQDIDVSTLFDAYREYLNELIIRSGAVVIDSVPTQGSTNAVSSGGVYDALHDTDTTLTQSGQAADAKVTGERFSYTETDIKTFKDNLLERIKLSANTSASNWALTSNYLSVSDSNAILYKYAVTAGDEIYLTLEEYGGCTAIFQAGASIPSSGTNANKKGNAIIGGYTGYVTVPEGATYLIISQAKTNTTNAVYSLRFTDARTNVIKESADVNLFATGGINISTGILTYASAVTFMTENFIADSILKVTPNPGYYVAPFAYSHGKYIGCWNGTAFSKSSQSYIKGTVDFESLRESYPDYQWRILIGRLSSSYAVNTIRPNIIFTRVISLNEKEVESDDINGLLNQTTFKRGTDTVDNLVLLHFSDIHGNQDRLKDIISYYNAHSAYIDDVLDTGDDVAGQFSDGMTWWDAVDGAENILRCIGNHDAVQSQSNPSNILDVTTLAGAFFTPYIQNWEVTSYTENTTYYYKDYDNGIRLIVLDCMHASDSTQLAWLQTALDTALSNSKQVVIGYHYPLYPYVSVNCGFTPLVTVAEDSASVSSAIMQMVDAFQTAGGTFVCYLTGHEHHDRIMTSEAYPHQFCINIACATNVYAQYKNGDQSRYGNKYANAINLVTINPNSKCVIIKRIGADKDILGRDRVSMAYDYNSHIKLYG